MYTQYEGKEGGKKKSVSYDEICLGLHSYYIFQYGFLTVIL